MKRSPLKRGRLRSRPKTPSASHRAATRKAHDSACLLCGRTGSCVPAHYPEHRGSGGKWPDPWAPELWVPLCGEPGGCHDWIDARTGGQMPEDWEERRNDLQILEGRAREWWAR